jgi:succinate dehydrogenase/fumarate reductase flavoprotein subunit
LLRRAVDQLRAGRTLRLAAGNALVGGLASAAFGRGARLMVSAPALRLIKEGDRVTGAFVDTPQGPMRIEARRGVVIATGGFQHDSEVRARLFPTGATNPEVWGAFPYGNAGDGIRMGVEAGGVFDTDMKSPIALSPLTRLHSGEGVLEVAPVLFNFKMPGVIAVTRDGRRFVNESNSYHDFGVALLDKTRGEPEAVAWLICDHRALRRYGLGAVMPAPLPYRAQIRSGYLKRGATVRELAEEAGIDASGLEATIARFNEHARRGEDPEFGRGTNAFQRAGGDAGHKPNPCVAELARPPYYAVRVFVGSVGSFAGLKTDEHCRVIDEQGHAIEGLYAAGNDMASISGGDYIAGGITIGPAMTFGYIAARHAASAPSAGEQSPAAAAA